MKRLALLALLAISCAKSEGEKALPADAEVALLDVQLGAGRDSFTPLEDADVLRLQRGCQGLQHVMISVRAAGATSERASIELTLERRADGVIVVEHVTELSFTDQVADGVQELRGITLVVPEPDLIVDHDARIRVRLEDASGAYGEQQRDVRVLWGADDC